MAGHRRDGMRSFWDARAVENAVFYVDTSTDYQAPDMERFLASGRQIAAQILGRVPPEGRRLAVEIGPGLGRLCLAMAPHFEEVVGIDVSEEMIRRARELVTDRRVRFELGDGRSLAGIADGSADLVYEFTVFQHIPSVAIIDGYIQEAARVLCHGGVAAFQWNNQGSSGRWKLAGAARIAGRRLGVRRWSDPRFSRQFLGTTVSTGRLTAALDAAGFDVVASEGAGTLFAWVWARRR